MLARHRQSLILEDIRRAGSARVSDLTQRLGVSDMTIRRDLEALARAGLIEKVHGGAVLPGSPSSHEPGFEAKSVLEKPQKEAIARAAADLVTPGTAIALSAGTTTFALAQHLLDVSGLTIVTNSVRVADYLFVNGDSTQTVLLTGGVRTPSDALVGPIAVKTVSDLHVDCLLMGVHGMDPVSGFTTPNLMEAEMNRAMVASAGRLVVLADHTKWGIIGLSAIASLADASVLISDSGLSEEARDVLAGSVGELIIADSRDSGSARATAL